MPVLAADTLIEFEGRMWGKPRDREHGLTIYRWRPQLQFVQIAEHAATDELVEDGPFVVGAE